MDVNTTIEKLESLFDAKKIEVNPHKEELDFVERRSQIENEFQDFLSIEQYLYHFELFQSYGLEDVMLKRVEHEIWYLSRFKADEFCKSEFYNRFKDKRIIKKHLIKLNPTFMNTYDKIIDKQIEWAKNREIDLIGSDGKKGKQCYTKELNQNLFQELSGDSQKEIDKGDGGELNSEKDKPAKMQALHSSSATGVNIFEYWKGNDELSPILDACQLTRSTGKIEGKIEFESQYPINENFNKPPNIDVAIKPKSHTHKAYTIECKFSEPYSSYEHSGLKKKYFDNPEIWEGLSKTKALGKQISPNDSKFTYLHAAQLIKHILGLNQNYGNGNYRLLYLWYDAYGKDGYYHQKEIEDFKEIVTHDGIKFSSITYQELILKLANHRKNHPKYISYITDRYL